MATTLTKCLRASDLPDADKASLRKAQKNYKQDGMQPSEASREAVRDALDAAYAERRTVVGQIKQAGGTAPTAPRRWVKKAAQPRPAAEPAKAPAAAEPAPAAKPVQKKPAKSALAAPDAQKSAEPAVRNVAKLITDMGAAEQIMRGSQFHRRIAMPGNMDVIIDRHPYGSDGERLYVGHYTERAGELVLATEMVFDVADNGQLELVQTTRVDQDTGTETYGANGKLAEKLSQELLDQGFAKAKAPADDAAETRIQAAEGVLDKHLSAALRAITTASTAELEDSLKQYKRQPPVSGLAKRTQQMTQAEYDRRVKESTSAATAPPTEFTPPSPELFDQVLMHGDKLMLADGWVVRRARIGGEDRIEVVTATGDPPAYGDIRTVMQQSGAYMDHFNWSTRLFLNNSNTGRRALAKLIQQHPLDRVTKNKARLTTDYRRVGYTSDNVQQALEKHFGRRPIRRLIEDGRLIIHTRPQDLPEAVLAEAREIGVPVGNLAGVVDKQGVAHMVAETSATNPVGIYLHEIGVHAGLPGLLSPGRYRQVMAQVERLLKEGDSRVVAARSMVPEGTPQEDILEETLARLVQDPSNHEMGLVRRVFAAVRAWLFRMGLTQNLTPDVMVSLVRAAARKQRFIDADEFFNEYVDTRHPPKDDDGDEPRSLFTTGDRYPAFDIADEGLGDYVIRKFADRQRRTKKVIKAIRATGKEVPEEQDAYLQDELFPGWVEDQITAFEEQYVKPLMDALAKSKTVTLEDLGWYVYAKFAPERNAHVEDINPKFREEGIPGSGMSDEEAADILADFDQRGLTEELESMAKYVRAINDERLQYLEDSGLVDSEEIATWRSAYENYVPLRSKADKREVERMRVGRGFDIRGAESRRAMGRFEYAANPVVWSVAQMEETIIRAQKNRVGQAFLNLVEENPNPKLWSLLKEEKKPLKASWNEQKKEVEYRPTSLMTLRDDILGVKVDGEQFWIQINDVPLARGMKNLGVENTNKLVRALATFNRYLAGMATSFNPEFIPTNFARDIQTALINLIGEQRAKGALAEPKGMARKVLKDIPKAMAGAYFGLRPQAGAPAQKMLRPFANAKERQEWAKWFNEFRAAGGKIGFFGLIDVQEQQNRLLSLIKAAQPGATGASKRTWFAIRDFVEDVNGMVENATRLATYVNARRAGLTQGQAASLAKNLTVNFNRKGELGPGLNAAYLFFNAGLQGSIRMLYALKSPRVWSLMGGIMVTSWMLAELNRLIGGEDDEGRNRFEEMEDHIKERNLVLMRPSGDHFKFPLPYGYNIPFVLGTALSDAYHGKNSAQAAVMVINTIIESFNPVGTEDSDSNLNRALKMIMPTVIDPMVQIALNEDFAGRPIAKDQVGFGAQKPRSELYWESVSPISKAITTRLNELEVGWLGIEGGNPAKSGSLDINPEHIDHWVGFLTGGVGRFVNNSVNLPARIASEDEVPIYTIPFVRRFYGEPYEWSVTKRYWQAKQDVLQRDAEWKYWQKQGDRQVVRDFLGQNQDVLKLRQRLRGIEGQLRVLRDRRDVIKFSTRFDEKQRKEKMDVIEKRMQKLMKTFSKLYFEATRGNDKQ